MQCPHRERGASFIDVIVGSALMMIVFAGIAGAFQLAVDAVLNNKARAGAIALANERLEYVRSLPYDSIGVVGGIPAGEIPQIEGISLNGLSYTRRTFVAYQDDPGDGVGGADANGIIIDYKAVKSTVSWESRQGTRSITLVSRISPPSGIEYDVPGGTLSIVVVDAAAQPVPNAQVNIINTVTSPAVDLTLFTDSSGVAQILGAPPASDYQILVTKEGYSSAQTYTASAENSNPNPAHLAVALNQTTTGTFAIDLTSTLHVRTFEPIEVMGWSDELDTMANVDPLTTSVVTGGEVTLPDDEGSYQDASMLLMDPITPAYLSSWREFSWQETLPAQTSVRYRIYDAAGVAIPDTELPGNGAGFTSSPVDISSLSTTTYPGIRIAADLSTDDSAVTPAIESLALSYAIGPTPLPDVSFALRGNKTIGSNASGNLVYKYAETDLSSGASADVSLEGMEWDLYTLTIDEAEDLDIASSCPPQPVEVPAGASIVTALYLVPHTDHSLLVEVRGGGSAIVPGASVRLYRGAVSETVIADACGQAFFEDLAQGTQGAGNAYSIEVTADGYQTYAASDVSVSGTSRYSALLIAQ